jgi:hypothetical protein
MIGAGALLVIGSLLPWATLETVFGSVSKNGTSGDGVFTLVFGLIGILLGSFMFRVSRRGWAVFATIVFLLGAVVSVIDMSTLPTPSGQAARYAVVSVGSGLWLCLVASLAGAVASGYVVTISKPKPVASSSPESFPDLHVETNLPEDPA